MRKYINDHKEMHQLIRWFTSIAGPPKSVSEVNTKVKDLVLEGLYDQALKLYKDHLHFHSVSSSTFILPSLIKACSNDQTHNCLGLQLHCNVLKTGSESESAISNSLISMYAKFYSPECARKVFDVMPQRDTISWNSIINCYSQNGCFVQSWKMFREMYLCGFVPKPELIASVLSICVQTGQLRLGRTVHALVIVDERIQDNSVFLSTALINLYWRCSDSVMAFRVFDRMGVKNEVCWTAMVSGFVADHDYKMAVDFFRAMQVEGIKPNRITSIAILPACDEIGSIKHGKEIHGYAFRHGFDSDIQFSSALIHRYCKHGEALHYAKLIFERSKKKDVVMWSSIIGSCDTTNESVSLFNQMRKEGFLPNSVTLLELISTCTNLSSISHGHTVHCYVFKSGLDSELPIGNSLINMYSKCGYLMDSYQVFQEMPMKDSISWSTLISACGIHGRGEEALEFFYRMHDEGIEADSITYLAVLSACNHAGLAEEGQKHFHRAMRDDKISLTIEHYACYIDLLGRVGRLEDACRVVTSMPMKLSPRIWSSLVSACKIHGRLGVAKMLAQKLIEVEPDSGANRTLLSMVSAESGEWFGVEAIRREMKEKGVRKSYGFSRIELEK